MIIVGKDPIHNYTEEDKRCISEIMNNKKKPDVSFQELLDNEIKKLEREK